MHKISDYDKKQLDLMMKQLNNFEAGKIDLLSLQESLEFLLQAMEYVDGSWEYFFIQEVSTLASINAGMPDNVQINVKIIIAEAIENLKKLVKQASELDLEE